MEIKAIKDFLVEDDGIGTVEIILILLCLVGIVLIFKKQITGLVNDIFDSINDRVDGI